MSASAQIKRVHAEAAVMLKDAREHLQRVGWTRGTARNASGQVCLSRALQDVDGTKHGVAVDAEARRIVLSLAMGGRGSIPTWNDQAGRTKEEVMTLLEACEHVEQELAHD